MQGGAGTGQNGLARAAARASVSPGRRWAASRREASRRCWGRQRRLRGTGRAMTPRRWPGGTEAGQAGALRPGRGVVWRGSAGQPRAAPYRAGAAPCTMPWTASRAARQAASSPKESPIGSGSQGLVCPGAVWRWTASCCKSSAASGLTSSRRGAWAGRGKDRRGLRRERREAGCRLRSSAGCRSGSWIPGALPGARARRRECGEQRKEYVA